MNQNAQNLKTKNYDLYLGAMFAPKTEQNEVFAIFSIYTEIAEIPAKISEAMVGKIKLQWWRDVINEILESKPSRPHPALIALKDSPEKLAKFLPVIDEYERVIDGWQPRNLNEITEFLQKTTPIEGELGLAYGYANFASKLAQNSKFHTKFATNPEILIGELSAKAKALEFNKKSAFGVITNCYLNSLPNPPKRFFMLLKLLFSAKTMV